CHGADGRGSVARDNFPTLPDFTLRAWHEKRADPQLLVSVLEGKGTGMPPFRGKIGREQARGLIAFVRSFSPSGSRPASAAAPASLRGPLPQAPGRDGAPPAPVPRPPAPPFLRLETKDRGSERRG